MKATREGNPQAQYELGLRYESGAWDVERDPEQARRWILKAAEAGHRLAMRTLAHAYAAGELGLEVDPERARLWAERAAAPPPRGP